MAFSVAIVISPGGTRFRWNRPSAARVSVSESQACSRPIEKRVPSGSESRSNNFNRPASRCQGRIARSPARCWRSFVDPGELVTPQTFGGTRGPSSSLVAVANLQDLQIEVDIDESRLARVSLGQRCVISPVSYPDKRYQGQVAEIAPVMDYLDSDKLVQYLVEVTGIPARVIRSDEEVARIRRQAQQAQQQQAQMQQAMMQSEQAKNVAPLVKAVGGLPEGMV